LWWRFDCRLTDVGCIYRGMWRSTYRTIRDNLTAESHAVFGEMIIEVLVFVFFINTFLLQSQTIPTPSMVNTMLIGDHLLVNKVVLAPRLGKWDSFLLPRMEVERGMTITFKGPMEMEKDYVKRVIGLPGETIHIKNKKVHINGKPLDEPYAWFEKKENADIGDNFPLNKPRIIDALGTVSYLPFYKEGKNGKLDRKATVELCEKFKQYVVESETDGGRVFKIPEGHYFCMGDNRQNSYDSRFWGPLPRDYIIGKPWRIYWSYESETKEYLTPGILHKIKDIFLTAVHFFTRTRWGRTFKKFD
ncbi:MAG: signal peptidase I, partial [bacterium]|nr:signal peptidase I [bacterium]